MKVESFTIDHKTLLPGIYLRKRGETYHTYDIRMFRPLSDGELESAEANGGFPDNERFLSPKTAHTLEHLLAFHLRDTLNLDSSLIYIGPMGCLTGFYIITSPELPRQKLVESLKLVFGMICEAKNIPAATSGECGNYAFNDLEGAKSVSKRLLETLF